MNFNIAFFVFCCAMFVSGASGFYRKDYGRDVDIDQEKKVVCPGYSIETNTYCDCDYDSDCTQDPQWCSCPEAKDCCKHAEADYLKGRIDYFHPVDKGSPREMYTKTKFSKSTNIKQSNSCLSHAECAGTKPFCYEGACSPCSECHYCSDGIDNTCGSCGTGYPTKEEGPCSTPDPVISCSTHADCDGTLPFCYEGFCNHCFECHYCHDGIDNTCGTCGTGYPTVEDGPCSLPKEVNPGYTKKEPEVKQRIQAYGSPQLKNDFPATCVSRCRTKCRANVHCMGRCLARCPWEFTASFV